MTTKEEPKQEISEEAKKRAANYMSLKGALEAKQIKCYCGHTTYCDCSPIETTPNKTNMTQQTAVEWLVEQMLKQGYFDGNKPLTFTNLDHLQQQAKEMEKQQIIDAYENGENRSAELYYNETFNQNPTLK